MSGPYLIRLNSTDGTKYNLLSWTMFCFGTAFFVFFVTCGSLITPLQLIPHIIACFIISGAGLVMAVYAVVKLVTFHKIKMSRSSNDDERTADCSPSEMSHASCLQPETDPLPIHGNPNTYESISPSPSPTLPPPREQSPSDSLLGLVSGESLRSRSWLYIASQAGCRFRRSFSYDSSVSASSMAPYAYGTFQRQDSIAESTVVNCSSSSSMVEHPIYSVPNKGPLRNDLGARSRSGLVEDQDYHLPFDRELSYIEAMKSPPQNGSRSCLKKTDGYSPLMNDSYASPAQAFLTKKQSQNQQGERSILVKDSGLSNPLYGACSQLPSNKDQSQNQQYKPSDLVKDSGLSNPLYGACSQLPSNKDQSQNQQRKRLDLVKDSCPSNPLYGACSQLSSNKDQLQNHQRKRSDLVKDSGPSKLLYGASCASSTQISKHQSQNRQGERFSQVKDLGSNSLYGASCEKFPQTSSNKDKSQSQQDAQSGLVQYLYPYNPLDGASYAGGDNSYGEQAHLNPEQADLNTEYYYPLSSTSCTSSSSFDKTTVIECPFVWPKTYQSSGDKLVGVAVVDYPLSSTSSTSSTSFDKTTVIECPFVWPKTYQSSGDKLVDAAVGSSMTEPTKLNKSLKGKRLNSASKVYLSKLQKRHDKKRFMIGMHDRTVMRPQVYYGMCPYSYVPRSHLKIIYARRISSYLSEAPSLDEQSYEESYMGPTRV